MASASGYAHRSDHIYGPGNYGTVRVVESLQVVPYPTTPNWESRFSVVAYGTDAGWTPVSVVDFALEADAVDYVDSDPDGLLI